MKFSRFFSLFLLLFFSKFIIYGQININKPLGSLTDSLYQKKNKKTTEIIGIAIPSAMITYGLISLGDNCIRKIDFNTKNTLERNNRFWHTKVDNYLQYSPAVAAYALKFSKIESTHSLVDMTVLYGLSTLLAGGIAQGTKRIVARDRPDNSDNKSFPSGHTQTAFVAAEFLYQEYKEKSFWIGFFGYSVATFTGIARVYNNKHWVSDVVAGAGIGILSTKFVYWVYPKIKKNAGKKENTINAFVFPEYSNGNISLSFSYAY